MNLATIMALLAQLPTFISAIEAILASGPAKTLEEGITELVDHNTPGKPNSAALAP